MKKTIKIKIIQLFRKKKKRMKKNENGKTLSED